MKKRKKNLHRALVCILACLSLVVQVLPQVTQAVSYSDGQGGTYTYWSDGYSFGWRYEWSDSSTYTGESGSGGSSSNSGGSRSGKSRGTGKKSYQYETASNAEELIAICLKYPDKNALTGIRNQINWMNQLYSAAVQEFISNLDLGDTLLISLLNHSDINTNLMTASYSMGDLNREIAKKIVDGAQGYADVEAIAKATGLKVKDVRSILERIAAGTITEKTIAVGKNRTRASTHGVYVNHQALKQSKVFEYLTGEVERMTSDPDALTVLCSDLGTGYVTSMISGYELDDYQIMLYKKYLAKTLDKTLDSENPFLISKLTKTDAYKVAKETKSVLSDLMDYTLNQENSKLSEEVRQFLGTHLKNGILTEREAREYLILSGQFEEGEHGIADAAKQIAKGCKHLQKMDAVLNASGKVFKAADKARKMGEFIEYWVDDYAQQEVLLDDMVDNLTESGADAELMVAAEELRQEYADKLSGTFDKMYSQLVDKGIGAVKSAFPPLGIAESCISLAGMLTGTGDRVDALETGLAMQGICKQTMADFENAVIAVNQGDTSGEALSRVMTTYELARQSMVTFYEAMLDLADTDAEKRVYEAELKKLEEAKVGTVTVSSPFGSAGGR